MIREWEIFDKLKDFNSLLNYTVDDFTPSGNLCYSNNNGEMLHQTPLQELLTSDGLFNISLIKVDIIIIIIIIIWIILQVKKIGYCKQTGKSSSILFTMDIQ